MTLFWVRFKWLTITAGAFVVGLAAIVVIGSIPPSDFPAGLVFTVRQNSTLSGTADQLAANHIVRSAVMYKAYVVLLHDGHGIQAGDYLFDAPQSALRVAYRTAYGIEGLPKIKTTIPEGSDAKDISIILGKSIAGFASTTFLSMAKSQEGYLFPDTYYFYKNTTPQQAIESMKSDFDARIATISSSISAFGKPIVDVVKMASIVEKEATSTVDRRIIAGILWKRLADKYPLQVDPPFYYFLGKDSAQLTLDDLAVDSPYNLYKHTGLPPTPIDSPSLDAILATVTPTDTPYWYYLSDKHGNMHYSATFDGQLVNKAKYLQ